MEASSFRPAQLGAPQVVLVCGAVPSQPLELSRRQIRDGIEAVLPHAERHDVQLAIEPLHPMYADDRSAITTLGQANDMAEAIDSAHLGVALDVYHLWWDPDLEAQIKRCGTAGNATLRQHRPRLEDHPPLPSHHTTPPARRAR